MEYQVYETDDDYTLENIKHFEVWLDATIGTEYDRNETCEGYYLIIVDLTHEEVAKIRTYERTLKHD